MMLKKVILPAVLAIVAALGPVRADVTQAPTGPVVLTVTGLDEATYPGGSVAFDVPKLQAMGTTEITTSSIWTEGTHVYVGVLLSELITALHLQGKQLRLHALNDYAVDFPADEATSDGPILAHMFDGAAMSVRDKGPIWVIYPYDAGARFRTDTTYSRSIWQLDQIDVVR